MADHVELVNSRRLCAAQIEPMRVEALGVRRRWAIRKQLRVGALLRGLAGVENPRRLGIGIDELESGAFLHPAGDQPSRAWKWNQVFRIRVAADESPSVRGRARSRTWQLCSFSVKP